MSKVKPGQLSLDHGQCEACGALLYWVQMASGNRMPVERGADTRVLVENGIGRVVRCYVSHFAKCPNAERFRGRK